MIMVACIFLTIFLPIAIGILLSEFQSKIVARSESTPLVIGARGSGMDLTLQSLYFKNRTTDTIPFQESLKAAESGRVTAIPIHSRYTAREFPVVGTDLKYFEFRKLKVADGNMLTILGDCVLGSTVAERLGLSVGEQLLTDPENSINFAGDTPLNMNVRGILAANNSPDDGAIFVDLKTAWVIQGLGHGHQNLEDETDTNIAIRRDDKIEARATVRPFLEINEKNIDSFHFHGSEEDFPISAVIAVPHDEKSETMFMGQYVGAGNRQIDDTGVQLVNPATVIQDLMSLVFRVKQFFDVNALLVSLSTILLLVLVVLLSSRLRAEEMATMFKLGCSRSTIFLLQVGELLFVFLLAGVLIAGAVALVKVFAGDLVLSMLVG
jgi:putative ABC transport system permease protein